jgi:putative CocE/NonD family hydrolase
LWGSSYLGIVQWVIADHPLVKAMVPGITASDLSHIVFPDGSLDLGLIMRWMSLLRLQQKRRSSMLQLGLLLEIERDIRPTFSHFPLTEADQVMRNGAIDYYGRWMKAVLEDETFAAQLRCIDQNKVAAPVHLIGGWYDFFLRCQLDDYAALRSAGHAPYLTIGPWTHFSHLFLMVAMLKPGLNWFDVHLKKQAGNLRAAPVRLFVMGANEWRDYADFPPPTHPRHYYLTGGSKLASEPRESPPSRYCYDPSNPARIVGGTQFHIRAGARDNRKLSRRADALTFTSDPLEQPIEVIGSGLVELYVHSSSEFTDFFARLCDVLPNGHSRNICDGLFRVEPRNVQKQPDGSAKIQVRLWATVYRFMPGHCIQLIITSSAHPRWARHTNTPHPFTDTEYQKAEQTVYHDTRHPSVLILPTVEMI